MCGPLSVVYMTIVSSAMPRSSSAFEHRADVLVVVDHRVVVFALPAAGLADALRLGVRAEVHVGEIHPEEQRLAGLVLPLDEIHGTRRRCRRRWSPSASWSAAGVLDRLLADLAEARIDRRVVRVGRLAVQHAARAELRAEVRILRIVRQSPALPRRSGGRGCRRTRRSRGPWAGTRCGRRGGSCRTGRWRSPAA